MDKTITYRNVQFTGDMDWLAKKLIHLFNVKSPPIDSMSEAQWRVWRDASGEPVVTFDNNKGYWKELPPKPNYRLLRSGIWHIPSGNPITIPLQSTIHDILSIANEHELKNPTHYV